MDLCLVSWTKELFSKGRPNLQWKNLLFAHRSTHSGVTAVIKQGPYNIIWTLSKRQRNASWSTSKQFKLMGRHMLRNTQQHHDELSNLIMIQCSSMRSIAKELHYELDSTTFTLLQWMNWQKMDLHCHHNPHQQVIWKGEITLLMFTLW